MGLEIAAFFASLAALLLSGVSLFYSHRSTAASQRSAEAAEMSALQARRSADADQAIAELARADADRRRVDFKLDHHSGAQFILRNDGTNAAYGVDLDFGDIQVEQQRSWFEVFPDRHEEVLVLPITASTKAMHVEVSFHLLADQSDTATEAVLPIAIRKAGPTRG